MLLLPERCRSIPLRVNGGGKNAAPSIRPDRYAPSPGQYRQGDPTDHPRMAHHPGAPFTQKPASVTPRESACCVAARREAPRRAGLRTFQGIGRRVIAPRRLGPTRARPPLRVLLPTNDVSLKSGRYQAIRRYRPSFKDEQMLDCQTSATQDALKLLNLVYG